MTWLARRSASAVPTVLQMIQMPYSSLNKSEIFSAFVTSGLLATGCASDFTPFGTLIYNGLAAPRYLLENNIWGF